MQKFLLLHTNPQLRTAEWQAAAQEVGIDLVIAGYHQIRFHFSSQGEEIWVKNIPLREFQTIFFRTKTGFEEELVNLVIFAKEYGIRVVDSILTEINYIDRKSWQYAKLSYAKLPLIESWVGRGRELVAIVPDIFPVVLKETDLDQGQGVFLAHSRDELQSLVEQKSKLLVVQPFIENDGDVRVFVCFGEVLGSIKRSSASKQEFRNNVATGGSSAPFPLTPELEKLALTAAKTLKYDVAGVDLIFDTSSRVWRIMEVNCAPQYKSLQSTLGKNIPVEVLRRLFKH